MGKDDGAESLSERLSREAVEALRLQVGYDVAQKLNGLLRPGVSVTLTCRRGPSRETGEEFAVEVRGDGVRVANAEAESLEDLLELLNTQEKTRRCLGPCGQVKPYSAFSRLKSGPDGKNRYCKECEKRRVKEWSQKQKGENN